MDKKTQMEFEQIGKLYQARRFQAAKAGIRQALMRYPRAYFLHATLGAIEGNLNNWRDARGHFRKATKIDPKNFEALCNLAKAERRLGDLVTAQKLLLKSVRINPKYAYGWCVLGNVYADRGQQEKAVEAYRRALGLNPVLLEAVVNLLSFFERANRLEEMKAVLDQFELVAPDETITNLYRGIQYEREKNYPEALKVLGAVSYKYDVYPDLAQLERSRLNHLAKINDIIGNAENAYGLFMEANRVNARALASPKVSAARFINRLRKRQSYYLPGFSQKWETGAENTDTPVFMVGFPRSGTTLLDTFLRGHSAVSVIEERPLVYDLRQGLGLNENDEMGLLDGLSADKLAMLRQAYLKSLNAGQSKPVIIDKLPLNIAYAGEILRVFPKAKFILSLRDPADAVFSCFMQPFALNDAMACFDTPENAAKTYDLAFSIWQQVAAELGPALITCRYEELIADPKAILAPITEFLGVPWEETALNFQETAKARDHISTSSYAQVVEPLYSSAKGRWVRYAHLMPDALKILAPWRTEFGYSD